MVCFQVIQVYKLTLTCQQLANVYFESPAWEILSLLILYRVKIVQRSFQTGVNAFAQGRDGFWTCDQDKFCGVDLPNEVVRAPELRYGVDNYQGDRPQHVIRDYETVCFAKIIKINKRNPQPGSVVILQTLVEPFIHQGALRKIGYGVGEPTRDGAV